MFRPQLLVIVYYTYAAIAMTFKQKHSRYVYTLPVMPCWHNSIATTKGVPNNMLTNL